MHRQHKRFLSANYMIQGECKWLFADHNEITDEIRDMVRIVCCACSVNDFASAVLGRVIQDVCRRDEDEPPSRGAEETRRTDSAKASAVPSVHAENVAPSERVRDNLRMLDCCSNLLVSSGTRENCGKLLRKASLTSKTTSTIIGCTTKRFSAVRHALEIHQIRARHCC